MINVGLISAAEDNELSLVRGSKLPVQVRKWFDADQVLKSAVKKHADHDQHFCDIENYCLMYPDMKIGDVVPGTQQLVWELVIWEWVINPNASYDNTISTEKFFRTALTNQDGKFKLESPTNYETCVSSERLENDCSNVSSPIVSTKHMDSNEESIVSVLSTPEISNAQSIYYPRFQPPLTHHQHFHP